MFLVNIHPDVIHAIHIEGARFWRGSSRTTKTYSKRGALFYCVALPDIRSTLPAPALPVAVSQQVLGRRWTKQQLSVPVLHFDSGKAFQDPAAVSYCEFYMLSRNSSN